MTATRGTTHRAATSAASIWLWLACAAVGCTANTSVSGGATGGAGGAPSDTGGDDTGGGAGRASGGRVDGGASSGGAAAGGEGGGGGEPTDPGTRRVRLINLSAEHATPHLSDASSPTSDDGSLEPVPVGTAAVGPWLTTSAGAKLWVELASEVLPVPELATDDSGNVNVILVDSSDGPAALRVPVPADARPLLVNGAASWGTLEVDLSGTEGVDVPKLAPGAAASVASVEHTGELVVRRKSKLHTRFHFPGAADSYVSANEYWVLTGELGQSRADGGPALYRVLEGSVDALPEDPRACILNAVPDMGTAEISVETEVEDELESLGYADYLDLLCTLVQPSDMGRTLVVDDGGIPAIGDTGALHSGAVYLIAAHKQSGSTRMSTIAEEFLEDAGTARVRLVSAADVAFDITLGTPNGSFITPIMQPVAPGDAGLPAGVALAPGEADYGVADSVSQLPFIEKQGVTLAAGDRLFALVVGDDSADAPFELRLLDTTVYPWVLTQ